MELYGEDLSLFSGDILSSFPLFEDLADYDNLKTDLKVVDTEEFIPSKDDIETLVSNLGSLEPNEDDVTPWMENKVNLLDLLMNEEHDLPGDDIFSSSVDITIQPPEATVADSVQDISVLGHPQHRMEDISFSIPTQQSLGNLLFSSDSQQVCPPAVTMDTSIVMDTSISKDVSVVDTSINMDASINCNEDSGVELSICESDQSLLELLPQQLIESLDDPASLSMLLGNVDDAGCSILQPAASLFPMVMEKSGALVSNVLTTFVPPTISLGESDGDGPSSPSSSVSVDMGYISPPNGSPTRLDVRSPTSTVDLDQFLSEPGSPSYSVSSVSSGRNSPYAREYSSNTKIMSSGSLKTTSGTNQIKDKKLRKMRQNKDAATRYRIKKKLEGNVVEVECEVLEKRNAELRDQVETMTREIAYLKELMADVYQAKLAVKASKHT